AERDRERGARRRQRRPGPRGAARPGGRSAPRRRRPSARRARRQGAAAGGPSRRSACRLCLVQPDHARKRRPGARRRVGLPPRAGASCGHVPAHAARRDRRHADPLVSTYDALASLPLQVEGYELERLEQAVSSDFTRVTTVVHLQGGGEEGVGEDVTYAAELHPPPRDLALRQAGRSLAEALGREPRPVRFVVSKRIDSLDKLRRLLDRFPGTRLKLDPTSEWTDDFVASVAATGAVDVVDLKGAYHG